MPANCALEIFLRPLSLTVCRSTNFIVRNANGTAKSSSGHPIGRARSARIAVRSSWTRSSPPLPRPAPTNHPPAQNPVVATDAAARAAAIRVGLEIPKDAICEQTAGWRVVPIMGHDEGECPSWVTHPGPLHRPVPCGVPSESSPDFWHITSRGIAG